MSELLEHWHPVLLSRELGARPIKAVIDGVDLAVFRPAPDRVAAITDICPHRMMSLSMGKVCEGKLQCLYHGWSFTPNGDGASPGTPKMYAQCDAYETREEGGLVWVRRQGSTSKFPAVFERYAGYEPMVQMAHDVEAPLELVLDNFNELEHTATTHTTFGYPLERMHEVQLELKDNEDSVGIHYHGPSKPYDFVTRLFLGMGTEVVWHIDGMTEFSPVLTHGEYRWWDSVRRRWGPVRVVNIHILTPVSREKTKVFTVAYMRPGGGWRRLILPVVKKMMHRQYMKEVDEDQRVLNGLVVKNVSLVGLKLSRFDRVMGMNRKRIASIYRKEADPSGEEPREGSELADEPSTLASSSES